MPGVKGFQAGHDRPVLVALVFLTALLAGCGSLAGRFPDPPDPPLTILVAQVVMEAPITQSADIRTADGTLSGEDDRKLLVQLVTEIEAHAQQIMIERLSALPGFRPVPFEVTRRMTEGLRVPGQRLTDEQLRTLGRVAGVDLALSLAVDDYGRLQWHHWGAGWFSVAATHTTIVGAATAWNPLAMGAYLAWDLTTDLPLWYGGAYVLGWAFRPVHAIADVLQLRPCPGPTWRDEEVVIVAGRKALSVYPEERRKRKEVQLRVNLEQALQKVADMAGKTLRAQVCEPN